MRKWLSFLLILGIICGLAVPGGALTLHFRYPESQRVLLNPYIGNMAWGDSTSEREQPFTLVYCDATWAQLEAEKGVYDFSAWEEEYHLEHWRAEGKHVVFRLVLDRPGSKKHMDIPQWLYDEIDGDGEYYRISYGRGFTPNYANPVLMEAHARLVEALGEQYGDDPLFAYVQLGSMGHWGEWHIHDSVADMPPEDVRDAYVAPYPEAFPNAFLLMRRPFTHVVKYGTGLYNDSAGDVESTERWLRWIDEGGDFTENDEEGGLVAMPLAWQTVPIGGELSTYHERPDYLEEDMREDTFRLFAESHASWIGPGSFVEVERDGPLQPPLDELLTRIGYRLRVSEMMVDTATDEAVTFRLVWENTGNAPFYFGWQPTARITSAAGEVWTQALELNLLELLPGAPQETRFSLSAAALSGEYTMEVGIVNPQTGEAGVSLAMGVAERDGWHELCSVSLSDDR